MKNKSSRSIIWGLILIGLGIGFLLDSLNIIDFDIFISQYWPLAVIAFGINEYWLKKTNGALFIIFLGILLQLSTLKLIHANIWSIFWPLVIIWVGIRMIINHGRNSVHIDSSDFISETAVFSGFEKKMESKSFKGANVSGIFGGGKIDLRDVEIDQGGAIIDVFLLFGGMDILVPRDIRIDTKVTAIFGGVGDKRSHINTEIKDKPVLRIQGTALFAGMSIKD